MKQHEGNKPSLDALSASLLTARRNADLLISSASQSTPIRCVRQRRNCPAVVEETQTARQDCSESPILMLLHAYYERAQCVNGQARGRGLPASCQVQFFDS